MSSQLVADIAFPSWARFAVVTFEDGGFDEVASYHRTRTAAVRAAAKARKAYREERYSWPRFMDVDDFPKVQIQVHTLRTIARAFGAGSDRKVRRAYR